VPADNAVARLLPALALPLIGALAGCGTVEEPHLPPPHPVETAAHPLSHDDCVRLAIASAPNAAAFTARRLAAEARLRAASAWPNPTLGVSLEDMGLDRSIAQQTVTLGMSLSALFTHGYRTAAAEHDHDAAVAALEHEVQQLELEVRSAYDELVAARERAALQADAVAVAARAVAAARRFAAAGVGSPTAADIAQATLTEAEIDRNTAVAAAARLAIAFAFALGFERVVELQLSEPVTPANAPPADVDGLLRDALAARADLRAATAHYAAELERAHLAASPARFLPTISAGPRFIGSSPFWVANVDVELPLFDAGGALLDEQNAVLLQAAADIRRTAQQVGADVALALADLTAAQQLGQQTGPLIEMRASLLARAERQFAGGEIDYAGMLAAASASITARMHGVDARLQAGLASNRLHAALGARAP
jgi:outer membrane protein TolC